MKPTLADSVTTSHEVLFREVEGEAVLLDLASERYFGLDEVGTRIWQLLQEHSSLRKVYEVLRDEYDVEPARLEEDLLKHVRELTDAGLAIFGTRYATAP
jgi:hypothetical protein